MKFRNWVILKKLTKIDFTIVMYNRTLCSTNVCDSPGGPTKDLK